MSQECGDDFRIASNSEVRSLRSWSELGPEGDDFSDFVFYTHVPSIQDVTHVSKGDHAKPSYRQRKVAKKTKDRLRTSERGRKTSWTTISSQTEHSCEAGETMQKVVPNVTSRYQRTPRSEQRVTNRLPVDFDEDWDWDTMRRRNSKQFELPDDSLDISEQMEKARTKLMSVWNNVKYGWTIKMRTNFREDSPIWLLGELYHTELSKNDDGAVGAAEDAAKTTLEMFQQDFTSRLWFTYRRQFPSILGSNLTTDCGWGCMLRSGQMLLAQGLAMHFLKRDWRLYHEQSREQDAYHRQIIRWCGDTPSDQSPFSVHRLVSLGQSAGKEVGDWYGPASVAHILKDALEQAPKYNPLLSNLCLYVAQDCTIYKEDVLALCTRKNRHLSGSPEKQLPGQFRAVLVLVPARLGGEQLNPIYIPCVKALLAQPSCIGIIGGRPKHSLYFVGWQDEKLVHLDPHYCQDVIDTTPREFPIHTFHCMSPRKMRVDKMDPSCTFGFYCRTRDEFLQFCASVSEVVSPPKQKGDYPIFIIAEGSSDDYRLDLEFGSSTATTYSSARSQRMSSTNSDDSYINLSHPGLPPHGKLPDDLPKEEAGEGDEKKEDFVFL